MTEPRPQQHAQKINVQLGHAVFDMRAYRSQYVAPMPKGKSPVKQAIQYERRSLIAAQNFTITSEIVNVDQMLRHIKVTARDILLVFQLFKMFRQSFISMFGRPSEFTLRFFLALSFPRFLSLVSMHFLTSPRACYISLRARGMLSSKVVFTLPQLN